MIRATSRPITTRILAVTHDLRPYIPTFLILKCLIFSLTFKWKIANNSISRTRTISINYLPGIIILRSCYRDKVITIYCYWMILSILGKVTKRFSLIAEITSSSYRLIYTDWIFSSINITHSFKCLEYILHIIDNYFCH